MYVKRLTYIVQLFLKLFVSLLHYFTFYVRKEFAWRMFVETKHLSLLHMRDREEGDWDDEAQEGPPRPGPPKTMYSGLREDYY